MILPCHPVGYHIVNVLPIIQRDQLKRRQHGPHEIIEIRITMIRISADPQARVIGGTVPGTG